MATPPRKALAEAGLPTIRVGAVALAKHVPRVFARSTEDLDLAVTLPRDEALDDRRARALQALGRLGYRTDPTLIGPVGSDFIGFTASRRIPAKLDLFLNGVCDFADRDDGRGTGCKIHVDDETGAEISKEGLLLCKLVADRPNDWEDVAALLITGFDRAALLHKVATQLRCPGNGQARVAATLVRIRDLYAGDGPHHPRNAALDLRRADVSARAADLLAEITGAPATDRRHADR